MARWWDLPDERFPWDEPEATRLTIVAGGAVAGLIQFSEAPEPRYRHASVERGRDRAYEKAGFRRFGVTRRYERDTDGEVWHGGPLMELLAGEERG